MQKLTKQQSMEYSLINVQYVKMILKETKQSNINSQWNIFL